MRLLKDRVAAIGIKCDGGPSVTIEEMHTILSDIIGGVPSAGLKDMATMSLHNRLSASTNIIGTESIDACLQKLNSDGILCIRFIIISSIKFLSLSL